MAEIAYIDESRRAARYPLAAALIDHQAVATVRQTVRALAPRAGSTRRHIVREPDASRRKCLAANRALDGVTVLISNTAAKGNHPSVNEPSASSSWPANCSGGASTA